MNITEIVAKAMFEAVEAECRDINCGRLRKISWEEHKAKMLSDPRNGDTYLPAKAAIRIIGEQLQDHYYDSMQKDKEIIMYHINEVLKIS